MKQLSETLNIKSLSEALKINSKSKISNKFENYILEILYTEPDDADPEEVKLINKWVRDTNIKYLTIVSTKDVLESYGYNEENDNTIEDLFNKYKDNEDINIVLDDSIYDTFSENIGTLAYKENMYERTEYYINKDMLTFKFRRSNYIFFVSDNKSDPI